ncbi:MAG: alpha/beta hydrolase [Acidobacteriaceae bacterium]|nr:alpha/beta hydrolase [Acidobacteriaceae bacterium]
MSIELTSKSNEKSSSPDIVLVHGALTGASVWNAVAERLQSEGFVTIAPALPLRGLESDAVYLSTFLDTLKGLSVLVGHSYGGSVISHPAVAKDHLQALVFVSAFLPDSGESTGELNGRWLGSQLGEATTIVRPYPGGHDLYLNPEHFAAVYAADLPPATVSLMAAAQRPIDTAALGEAFHGSPMCRSIPSWAVLSTRDRSLPIGTQRFMAKRAASSVVEIEASHVTPVSQPKAVADVIAVAARSTAGAAKSTVA